MSDLSEWVEIELGVKLTPWQREALDDASNQTWRGESHFTNVVETDGRWLCTRHGAPQTAFYRAPNGLACAVCPECLAAASSADGTAASSSAPASPPSNPLTSNNRGIAERHSSAVRYPTNKYGDA